MSSGLKVSQEGDARGLQMTPVQRTQPVGKAGREGVERLSTGPWRGVSQREHPGQEGRPRPSPSHGDDPAGAGLGLVLTPGGRAGQGWGEALWSLQEHPEPPCPTCQL